MIWGIMSAILSSLSAVWVIWLSTHEADSKHNHFKGLTVLTLLTCILAIGAFIANDRSQKKYEDRLNRVGTMTEDAFGPSISIQTFGLQKQPDGTAFVGAVLHNGGQSTAQKVHGVIVLVATDNSAPKPDFVHAYSETEAHGSGPIGKDQGELLRTAGSVSLSQLQEKRAHGSQIFTLGSVWYEDNWYGRHELAFCYLLNSDDNFEVRKAHTCDAGV